MRRPAEARSSEAASATLCSQGQPAEGKGKKVCSGLSLGPPPPSPLPKEGQVWS